MIVGIDIGTSYSSIAIRLDDHNAEPVIVTNGAYAFGDRYSLPSAIFIEDDRSIAIGQLAMTSRIKAPSQFKSEFKRDLGVAVPFILGDVQILPEEIYKEFFSYFKTCAEKAGGVKISKAYITYPANFNNKKRGLIQQAAQSAGLLDVELIDEPTAAAYYYYAKGKIKEGDILLVYDFGGGTFDVALIQYKEGIFRQMTPALGLDRCGGTDIDRVIFQDIFDHIPQTMLDMFKGNEISQKRFYAQIMEVSIRIKHELSIRHKVKETIPVGFDVVEYEIDRNRFNGMIASPVEETMVQLKQILRNANLKPGDINTVLVAGGTSRIPYIQEKIQETIGQAVNFDIDPELAICSGAALWAPGKQYTKSTEPPPIQAPPSTEPQDNQTSTPSKHNSQPKTPGRKSAPVNKVLGIDLGATKSLVAIIEGEKAVIIPNAEGEFSTPSIVAFLKSGEKLVGQRAKDHELSNPKRTINGIKQKIGTSYRITIDHQEYTPQKIAAELFTKLKSDAEKYLDGQINQAVLTVPTYYNYRQRQALREAAEMAGIEVLRIVDDSTAVALAYGIDEYKAETILIVDLGGSSLSISIIEIGNGVFEVKAVSGNSHLGGDVFDEYIMNWLLEEFQQKTACDLRDDTKALHRVKEAAIKAKHELSSIMSTDIYIPYITTTEQGPVNLEECLTRSRFNHLTSHLVETVIVALQQAIKDAGLKPSAIDRVILAGGSSRIIALQEALKNFNGKDPFKGISPEEAVVKGAAIQGGILSGDIIDCVLLDVLPLSIGIETSGGNFDRIIQRCTTTPVSKEYIYTTAINNQPSMYIRVLQGEHKMADHNTILGQIQLSGIMPAPKGIPQVAVKMDIDVNGMLTVTAKDLGSGNKQELLIGPSSFHSMHDEEVIGNAKIYWPVIVPLPEPEDE